MNEFIHTTNPYLTPPTHTHTNTLASPSYTPTTSALPTIAPTGTHDSKKINYYEYCLKTLCSTHLLPY